LGSNQDNFQLHRFITRENIAKSLGGGYFLTHTVYWLRVWNSINDAMQPEWSAIKYLCVKKFCSSVARHLRAYLTVGGRHPIIRDIFVQNDIPVQKQRLSIDTRLLLFSHRPN